MKHEREKNSSQNINQIANVSTNRHHPPENEATLDTNKRRFLNFSKCNEH